MSIFVNPDKNDSWNLAVLVGVLLLVLFMHFYSFLFEPSKTIETPQFTSVGN